MDDIRSPYDGNDAGQNRGIARGRRRAMGCGSAAILVVAGLLACWLADRNRSSPVAETEIFQGVRYGCRGLSDPREGSGPMHWVRVDLRSPGVGIYMTPLDSNVQAEGYEYRLRRVSTVVEAEGLAVGVNGCLFTREPYLIPGYWPGQRARGVETVVADGRVSHIWEHTYLLWFDDALKSQLEDRKPPAAEVLARAKWGVGGQGVGLWQGRVSEYAGRKPEARTAIGIDPARQLLFLAVFESASERLAMVELSALGATEGMLLDGGGSSAMVLGPGARGVRPGTLLGGWRPVATQFGVRAQPLAP